MPKAKKPYERNRARTHRVVVYLSDTENEKLEALVEGTQSNASTVIRQSLSGLKIVYVNAKSQP
jgi:hypothetical protein